MLCGKKPLSYAIKEPFNKFIVPFLTEIYYRPTFNEKMKKKPKEQSWKKTFFELSYHSIQRSVHSSMTSRPSWLAQWCGKKAKKCFVRRNKFNAINVSDYYSYILKELCHISTKKVYTCVFLLLEFYSVSAVLEQLCVNVTPCQHKIEFPEGFWTSSTF